jgi:hypothetical protein
VIKKLLENKECKKCGKIIYRKRGVFSNIQWEKVKFCSAKCFGKEHSKPMTGHIPWNKGVKYSKELKEKFSISQKGKKYPPRSLSHRKYLSDRMKGKLNPGWEGGIYPANLAARHSFDIKLWREAVFKRDGWKCIDCGSIKKIEADHIKPFSKFPELRFDISNGRTLCHNCHLKTSTYGGRVRR